MSEDPKYKLAFLLTQIGLRFNEVRKVWSSNQAGPWYNSDIVTLVEACIEGVMDFLNERSEPIILAIEAIKVFYRMREWKQLHSFAIYSYISSSNFYKNYSTVKKQSISNYMISTNQSLPILSNFDYAQSFLDKMPQSNQRGTFLKMLLHSPMNAFTELFFILKPFLYMLALVCKRSTAPIVIAHIVLTIIKSYKLQKLNEFEYCENKIRGITLLSYLLLPPIYNTITKNAVTHIGDISPLLGTITSAVISFFRSYSFLL